MKYYLIGLCFASVLFAGTYDDSYTLVKTSDKESIEKIDPFMNGEFLEIRRFTKLDFSQASLDEASHESLLNIISTIKTYIKNDKNIKVKIIGHSSESIDIYNPLVKDTSSLDKSKNFAEYIARKLEDNNISKELLVVEYRQAKDMAYTRVTQEGMNLSNRVMLTLYVIAPLDKDSDGDGVLDSKDKCPDTPKGIAVDIDGCPLDTDKDVILDYKDDCPDTPIGVEVDEKGCPLDSDGDNVLDYKDKCPSTIVGLQVDADGCPISRTLQLNFAHKSSDISKTVYSQVIDFAVFLKENPAYKAEIIGHTDSVGKAGDNMKLSFDRAHSVRSALIKEGIDASRIESIGRGELSPLETNRTESGRATNRRIEVKLFN